MGIFSGLKRLFASEVPEASAEKVRLTEASGQTVDADDDLWTRLTGDGERDLGSGWRGESDMDGDCDGDGGWDVCWPCRSPVPRPAGGSSGDGDGGGKGVGDGCRGRDTERVGERATDEPGERGGRWWDNGR